MNRKLFLTFAGLATAGLLYALAPADKASTRTIPPDAQKTETAAPRMNRLGAKKSIPMRAPEGGYTAPVTFAPTQEQFDECVLIDPTGYNKNWTYNDNCFRSSWNSQAPMDAWCILPPMNLEAGAYKVTYTYYTRTDKESFSLSLGTSTEPESMTITVMERQDYSNETRVTESETVEIPTAGTWHFGLHSFSKANGFYIYFRDISIEMLDMTRPKAPAVSLEAVGYDATVTVTAPSENLAGEAIADSSVGITLSLDGEPFEEFTMAPGATRTMELSVTSSGLHTVSATATAGDKISEPGKAEHLFTKIQPVPTPMGYVFTPDEDEASWCTIVNSNNDNNTWQICTTGFPTAGSLAGTAFRYSYSWSSAADDWLILPAFEGGEAGARKVSFNLGTKFDAECLDVHMAYEPTVEALLENKIWSVTDLNLSDSFQMQEALFAAEGGKEFYVAFHVTSPANRAYLYLQHISVEAVDGSMPAAPALSDAEFDGGDGTVKLTMPVKNIGGEDMDDSTEIYADITLDGEPYGEPVKGAPGEVKTLEFSDLSIATHTVTATTYIIGADGTRSGNQTAELEFRCRISSNFAYQLPLDQELNIDTFDNFLVVNVNNDDRTWTGEEDGFMYKYSGSNAADDWFITPAIEVTEAGLLYDISICAKAQTTSYPECLEVYIGREQSVAGMTTMVLPPTDIISTEWNTFTGTVSLEETGRYYIGVHCISDANKYNVYVNRIQMTTSAATNACPGAVTGVQWESPETGELYADVTFTFPATNRGGETLDPETALTATVANSTETKTVEGKPGDTATVRLTCPRGNSTVKISVASEAGEGPVTVVEVNCGPDTPAAPVIADLTVSEDNRSVTIAYEAVTTTLNGGHVNIDGMDYYLWEWDEEDEDWYQCDVTDRLTMTYTIESPSQPLTMITLGLQASNGLNSFSAMTPFTVVLGKPHELPMEETFEENRIHYEPIALMSSYDDEYAPSWGIADPSAIVPGLTSPEGGYSLVGYTSFNRGDSYIILPRFSTEGMTDAEVELSVYQSPISCEISVAGITYGMVQYTLLGTITAPDAVQGWTKFRYTLPEELQNRPWTEIRLYVNFTNGSNSLPMIDSYAIRSGSLNGAEEIAEGVADRAVEGLAGAIRFTGFEGCTAMICDAAGALVAAPALSGYSQSVALAAGIYIVTVDGKPYKVAVR